MNKTQKLYTVSLAMEKHLTGNSDELKSSFKLLEEVRKELLIEETLPLKESEFWVKSVVNPPLFTVQQFQLLH